MLPKMRSSGVLATRGDPWRCRFKIHSDPRFFSTDSKILRLCFPGRILAAFRPAHPTTARFRSTRISSRATTRRSHRQDNATVLTLMTIRAHDQFNTVYSPDDRYRGVRGDRRVVFLHADDLASRGLRDGDRIDIETLVDDGHVRRVTAFTARAWDTPPRLCRRVLPGSQRPDRGEHVLRPHPHAAVQGDAGAGGGAWSIVVRKKWRPFVQPRLGAPTSATHG